MRSTPNLSWSRSRHRISNTCVRSQKMADASWRSLLKGQIRDPEDDYVSANTSHIANRFGLVLQRVRGRRVLHDGAKICRAGHQRGEEHDRVFVFEGRPCCVDFQCALYGFGEVGLAGGGASVAIPARFYQIGCRCPRTVDNRRLASRGRGVTRRPCGRNGSVSAEPAAVATPIRRTPQSAHEVL